MALLSFTPDEILRLGHTADALCAYLGKPVVAEIVAEPDEGFEWVLFAIPLGPQDTNEEIVHVQVGGPGARVLGSQGGLNFRDGRPLDCQLLWAIQLSAEVDSRFIKVDAHGDEAGWSDELGELLPFGLEEDAARADEEDEEPDEDDLDARRKP